MGWGHWDLSSHLLWLPTMEDMEEVVMVMGAPNDMAEEITIGRDTGMMTGVAQISQKGILNMNLEETLIMTPDRRKIHVFVSMVIPMRRKMTGNDRNNWNYHHSG